MTIELHNTVPTDPDDPSRVGQFDPYSKAPVSVDLGSKELHSGECFVATSINTALLAFTTTAIAFKTPPLPMLIHLRMGFGSTAGGTLHLREGLTWTPEVVGPAGGVLPIENRNRADPVASTLLEDVSQPTFQANQVVIVDPVVAAPGVIIHTVQAFGTNKIPAAGEGMEFILAPDTTYGAVVTVAVNSGVQLEIDWTEHISE